MPKIWPFRAHGKAEADLETTAQFTRGPRLKITEMPAGQA